MDSPAHEVRRACGKLVQARAPFPRDRHHANLTSVLRLFILDHYRVLASGAEGTSEFSSSTKKAPPQG